MATSDELPEVAPSDAVGTALRAECDSGGPLARVYRAHLDRPAAPSWQDYRVALQRCPVAAVFDIGRFDVILRAARGREADGFEQVHVQDGAAVAHTARVSATMLEHHVDANGQPDLRHTDSVAGQFRDGDQRRWSR